MVPNFNSIVSLLLWLLALKYVFCTYSGFAPVLPIWSGPLLHILAKEGLGMNPFFCCFFYLQAKPTRNFAITNYYLINQIFY